MCGSLFEDVCHDLGQLLTKKNTSYGDAFAQSENFLKILYPNGIQTKDYRNMLAIVRIFDKMKRIATDKDAFGESPWHDIAGYAVLSIVGNQNATEDDEDSAYR